MKLLAITMIMFTMTLAYAQSVKEAPVAPLIGDKAPKFTAESTQGKITFPNDFGKAWKILFSHPADFTPVCTSEILELCNSQSEFKGLDVKIAVLSTDKIERHKLWVESMEGLTYKDQSNYKVDFPLIADPDLTASRKYGMIHPNSATTKNVRGVFIIDPDNNIRSIMYYPMEIGRNFHEIERTVLALQRHDNNNVMTPANWNSGEDVIVPFMNYSPDKDVSENGANPDVYSVSWYLFMTKDNAE